jgi:pyridoxine 4-dehydrogenase
MSTTTIKKTWNLGGDMTINRLGYGSMRITGKGIWGPPADKNEAIRVLRRAVELGVNFIDTADSYGPNISEELIAEALHPYKDDLVIATKGGLVRPGPDNWQPNGSAKHLKEVLEGSLKRLKLEWIDLYQLHRIDPNVPREESFEFLQRVQQEGKVKHIGLSEVSVADIKDAQEYFEVVSVQNMYNIGNRNYEEVLQYCIAQGIAFIPWFPLNAGDLKSENVLNTIAAAHGAAAHQVALSWLYQHSDNILLIPGTSSVKHLEENLKVQTIVLTPQEMETLDTLAE